MSYDKVFLLGLIVPVISVSGAVLVRLETSERRPIDWRILGGGLAYGETDDWGWDVVKDPVHVHDVQATVLHALGLDHLKLVTSYQGRDFRLTDVAGNVVKALLA